MERFIIFNVFYELRVSENIFQLLSNAILLLLFSVMENVSKAVKECPGMVWYRAEFFFVNSSTGGKMVSAFLDTQ